MVLIKIKNKNKNKKKEETIKKKQPTDSSTILIKFSKNLLLNEFRWRWGNVLIFPIISSIKR
jgi:hypothetical protein